MRVLVVEDEPEYLEMLQDVVKSIGHSVCTAHDGAEALRVLDEEGKVDVIVSDVAMPIMDGIEFHEQVRARPEFAITPFIFLTGIYDLSRVKQVCTRECDLLLQKPFPVDKLIQMFAGQIK
jgi:two-component system CheB/CheR fusion protein